MATTRNDIRRWLEDGKRMRATHMLVVCDTFDYEDYPVFVKQGEDVEEKYAEYNGKNMQTVMEVYSLKKDAESQINEHRAFHFD